MRDAPFPAKPIGMFALGYNFSNFCRLTELGYQIRLISPTKNIPASPCLCVSLNYNYSTGLDMTAQLPSKTLYEQDYYLWLETTLQQLQQIVEAQNIPSLPQLDWEHLIEEIEGLGIEQRRKAASYLKQLLIHLLLYRYWESERAYCGNGWKLEIGNFRDELEWLLDSKTLKNYLVQQFDQVYEKARKRVIDKTGLPANTFPTQCPFTVEEVLNPDYLPD